MEAITRFEPTRQAPTLEDLFARLFGAIPEGSVVTTEYLSMLAHHGREFFDDLSCMADPEGKSAGERLRAYWYKDPAANPLAPAVAFFDEVLVRLKSASTYGLPHSFTRGELEALFADIRQTVESGVAVDGGSWVEVEGREGLVRLGEARAHGWKVKGE